jgi:hypothetical protein
VRKPRYGPGCKKLYFSRRVGRDHDLFAYDFATKKLETVSAEPAFELYPAPAKNGVYYVSARDGDMNLYYRGYDGSAPVRVTQALTAHHHPVDTPEGVVFSRLYGTGFHLHLQRHDSIAGGGNAPLIPKVAQAESATAALPASEDYYAFSPKNLVGPSYVPLLDLEYDSERSYGSPLQVAGGLELYVEDQLNRHALLLRGFAGNRSSALFDYRNAMLPVQLRARAGLTDVRSLYTYRDPPNVYEHVTDSRWGFLYGALGVPLNLYYSLGASAETTRDFGTTTGARDSPFDFADPRYARELYGLVLSYDGIDRRDPTFRERDINKRGYRQFTLAAFYGRDHVHPLLARYEVPTGTTPYFRAEYHHSEYLGLPALFDGFFDHSLQLDLELGYISEDIQYLPFYGGGRLYSLSVPEVNTSVGFVGYSFAAVRGETLANLGISYRGPIARNLGWEWGPFFLEDVYFQLFTSWGNIWSFDTDGSRQVPFVDRAANGRHLLGDVGVDLRLGHFLQELETNVGTTLRVVYRLIPFSACPDEDVNEDRSCLGPDGERGLLFYAMVGGGF